MTEYRPLRDLPLAPGYGPGDVLVLIGELFGRGYANGIIDAARRQGVTIIGTTVGRRDSDGTLRPLTAEELAEAEANLGGGIVNIPLEAGFDMDGADGYPSPCDLLRGVKPDRVDSLTLDRKAIDAARRQGVARFVANMLAVAAQLATLIPAKANVIFAHAMAGGIPRTRVLMPLLNRVFKGTGEKFMSSETFWQTDLGRLCSDSFDEVTAETFRHLIEATSGIRERNSAAGGRVSYTAYGYHGCEVLIGGTYTWQSYTPYLQGWAKMRLEAIAEEAWSKGIKACVFNAPEILTNSSALFLGLELSLYPLLSAVEREGGGDRAAALRQACQDILREGETVDGLLARADAYLASPLLQPFADYSTWPHHNTSAQAELMLGASAELMAFNADPKRMFCSELSQVVFTAVGDIMFASSWELPAPVLWLNHDVVARSFAASQSCS
jgi:hypothetical protein